MWLRLGRPGRFSLVEQGANDGQLAVDILSAMDEETLPAIEYWIVEPFPILRRLQEQTLKAFGATVHWAEDLDDLPVFDGVHLSNELVDALPFHLMRSKGQEWEELRVAAREDRLVFEVGEPERLARRSESERFRREPKAQSRNFAQLRSLGFTNSRASCAPASF